MRSYYVKVYHRGEGECIMEGRGGRSENGWGKDGCFHLPDRVSRAAGRVSVDRDYFVEQKEFLRDRIGGFASSDELCPIYVYI